jgi:hypothetical protein
MKLVSKRTIQYKGPVFDLTVEGSHTYNVESLAVHNSGAGSLISYLLNITAVDPIKWNLQFERFLSENSTSLPDIDVDFEDSAGIKDHLKKLWGEYSVIPVSNFNTLKPRSLIKDLAKFFDIPFAEVNEVTGKMLFEATPLAKAKNDIQTGAYEPTLEELIEFSPTLRNFLDRYPEVEPLIRNLAKQLRNCFSEDCKILTSTGEKDIHNIQSDDLIAFVDLDGNLRFNMDYEIYFNGRKEVFEIELENGIKIELTGDHEVLTQDGYKMVGNLSQGDILFSI